MVESELSQDLSSPFPTMPKVADLKPELSLNVTAEFGVELCETGAEPLVAAGEAEAVTTV